MCGCDVHGRASEPECNQTHWVHALSHATLFADEQRIHLTKRNRVFNGGENNSQLLYKFPEIWTTTSQMQEQWSLNWNFLGYHH